MISCNIYLFCKKDSFYAAVWVCLIIVQKSSLRAFTSQSYKNASSKQKQEFPIKCHSRTWCIPFYNFYCLLHLTFAAETAVFLVACLAFLASFAALLIHRKSGSYPCLPLFLCFSTVRVSQVQKWNALLQITPL